MTCIDTDKGYKDNLYLLCDCMAHILSFSYYEDNMVKNIFMMFYESGENKLSFLERINNAVKIIRNEPYYNAVILPISSIEKVIFFLEQTGFPLKKEDKYSGDCLHINIDGESLSIIYNSEFRHFDIAITKEKKCQRILDLIFKGSDTRYSFSIYDENIVQRIYTFLYNKYKEIGEQNEKI